MLGYTLNFECDNFEKLSIDKALELKNDNIVILLTEKCDNQLKDYYTLVRKLIISYNKVIILDLNSRIKNQIGMLMCLYGKYDIYNVEENKLNGDYISNLLEREPTKEEVETFIDADIVGYAEINDIIVNIIDTIKVKDIDKLTALIGENINEIEGFVGLIDYLRTMTEDVILENNKSQDNQEKVQKLEQELDRYKNEVQELNVDKVNYKKELSKAKAEVISLNEKLNTINESEPTLMAYNELKTQIINCKAQCVLYFKEVSHISYINSFISNLMLALEKIKQLKVKLIIYDQKTAFLNTYKPITLITSNDYASDRDRVVSTLKKMLLTEANQAILQDVLSDKWDVVIVYDRLKQATDLVSGNIVYKYWVLNSIKEFNVIEKEYKAKQTDVITRPGVLEDALTISTNSEYKNGNENAKLAYYFTKMRNTGNNNDLVFNIICKRANIINIKPR